MGLSSVKDALFKAFIEPFQSLERTIVYLCAFLGQFGSYGVILYLAFSFTGNDLSIVIGFFAAKFILANMVLLPLFFMLLKRFVGPVFFIICVVMQLFIALLVYAYPPLLEAGNPIQGFMTGLLIAIIFSPFWAFFHNLMLHFTSKDNRGHEVSIAELGLKIGVVTASMMSGLMLTFFPGILFPLVSLGCLIIGTIILSFIILDFAGMQPDKDTDFLKPYKDLTTRKWLSIATMLQAALTSLVEFFVPIWMKFLGFSAIITGGVLMSQIIVRTAISPITGYLFARKNGGELRLGSLLFMIGWAPWLFIQNYALLVFSFINWAVSSHTINVGMDGRWYDQQTLEGMASREILLGIGRLLCVITVIPLLMISPAMFIIASIALAIVMIGVSYPLRDPKPLAP